MYPNTQQQPPHHPATMYPSIAHSHHDNAAAAAAAIAPPSGFPTQARRLSDQGHYPAPQGAFYTYPPPDTALIPAGHPAQDAGGTAPFFFASSLSSPPIVASAFAASSATKQHLLQRDQQPAMLPGSAGGAFLAGHPHVKPAQPRQVWRPRKAPRPLTTRFAPLAFLLFLAYLAATGYYLYIRLAFTLDMGTNTP
jgi:hypothetical protein